MPPKVFICYARSDNESKERWLDRVREHLEPLVRQEEIEVFCDEVVELGEDWHERIQSQLREARVVLLLISRAFLASKYIASSEIPVLLHRAKTDGVRIIPIIVSPCAFGTAQFKFPDPKAGPDKLKLSILQSAGTPKESLCEADYGRQERILADVVETIARYAAAPPTKAKESPPSSEPSSTPSPRPAQVTTSAPDSTADVSPARQGIWTNSLGMPFVPVAGTEVRFCIWPTRVQDYEAFVRANPNTDASWKDPELEGVPITQGPAHPVVYVNWEEAKRFCEWLTQKEQREGRLRRPQYYRLPMDLEWTAAVGLPPEPGQSPADRHEEIAEVYPWGTQWPPPHGSGNFADESARLAFPHWPTIEGYRDGYATTSPVGEFSPSKDGLFDLSGNVWEWCEDWYNEKKEWRVLRGGSWSTYDPRLLLSSYRVSLSPGGRDGDVGFRVVLVGDGSAR